jgi:hypothetical protein
VNRKKKKVEPKKVKVLFSFKPQAIEKTDDESKGKLWFCGIASTEDIDLQGETLLADGLDFSYFIEHGWFNDEHSDSASDGLGKPTKIDIIDEDGEKKVYLEGYLYDTPSNKRLHDLMIAVEAAGDNTIGFSVFGAAQKRQGPNGKIVAKAWIKNIAITLNPVNTKTYARAMKKSVQDAWDVISKAMGDEAPVSAGMEAGYPVPTYLGGGKASPLFKQDLLSGKSADKKAGRKKMKQIFKKAEWDAMSDEVQKGIKDSLTAGGFEVEIQEDAAPDVNVPQTNAEIANDLIKSIGETPAANGEVKTFTTEQIESFNVAAQDHTDAVNRVKDVLSKSVEVLGMQNERVNSLEGKFDTLSKSVEDSLGKLMAAMRIPMVRKSVDATDVAAVEHPNAASATPGSFSQLEARDLISKAFSSTSDMTKKMQLKSLSENVIGGMVFESKDSVEKAINFIVAQK